MEEAQEFFWLMWASDPGTDSDHRILPSRTPTQISRRCVPSALADCTKRRSPQTTGDELPPPGREVFQSTSLSVHATGMFLSAEIPVPLGPRKRDQFSARTVWDRGRIRHAMKRRPNKGEPEGVCPRKWRMSLMVVVPLRVGARQNLDDDPRRDRAGWLAG